MAARIRRSRYHVELVWSPDDRAHYGEVYDHRGREVHVTDLHPSGRDASLAARRWIREQQQADR